MPINLTKGEKLNLSKHDASMTKVMVGLGWRARTTDGAPFDLDASAIMCGADHKAVDASHFVFYGQRGDVLLPDGEPDLDASSVVHMGDNKDGSGEGDDEQILIHLDRVPAGVTEIVIAVSIYEHTKRNQNFGMVDDAYVRLFNADNELGSDEVRFDLTEDGGRNACMIFAKVYRNGADWKISAVGEGYEKGLDALLADYGLEAEGGN